MDEIIGRNISWDYISNVLKIVKIGYSFNLGGVIEKALS